MGCLKINYSFCSEPKMFLVKNTLTTKESENKKRREYLFGFNGKEMDNEVKGTGASYDYGFRIYDPKLGRFLSVDSLTRKYAMLTPYQFASNTPIWAIDLDGLEAYYQNDGTKLRQVGDNTQVRLVNDKYVESVQNASAEDLIINSVDVEMKEDELNMRATLSMIMSIEGGTGPDRYKMKNGGGTIDNLDKHPGLFTVPARKNKKGLEISKEYKSSATGAYQFLKGTWDEIATKLGLTDFSEKSQDKAAMAKIKGRGGFDAATQGNVESIAEKLGKEWVSLPGASQSHTSMDDAKTKFKGYVSNELQGNSLIATPKGELLNK